ncbi:hypothetical protein [Streptomyces sp. NRRL WC-3742]|uniref:hypothetical protein n=1 Tax=Streptomyces sp. NRRL WC-3742 TaxID=1463934 RepID=UPI0004C9BF74|nr:hypothetical protein [Streptomyces sp. NRRL WC-3742]
MIEILTDMGLLTQPLIDLETVQMAGVALGAPATGVPIHRIVSAQFPTVARHWDGIGLDGEYFDSDNRPMTLEDVVAATTEADGFLHCGDQLAYKVQTGRVVGFAISGSHLSHFAHLTTYDQMLAAFGQPDRIREAGAYGDLVTYGNYYRAARKQVRWNELERRVDLINLGAFEELSGP